MPEPLITCPVCRIPNFTPRGFKAHKCKGGNRRNPETGLVEVVAPAKPARGTGSLVAAFHKPLGLQENIDSITQVTPANALARIKLVAANHDGYAATQVLVILEDALTLEVRTAPQRRSVIQALKQSIKKLGPAKPSAEPAAAIIPAADPKAVLAASRSALEKHREIIIGHEDKFAAISLGPRLQMGLAALQAYQVFLIPEPGKKNKAGKNQHSKSGHVTRDMASPQGFEGWIDSECPWFKRVTAYKYMTAVRGLGLDHRATEKQVAGALKLRLRKGPVTLKSLCDAAVEALGPPAPPEKTLQQTEFQFLVDGLKDFREEAERILALKDQLMANPEMHKVACARAYDILTQLTGTNWTPSDEPDELASIDPDSITL